MPPRGPAAHKHPCGTGTRDYRSLPYDPERNKPLKAQVALGEDSRRQRKQDMQSPDAMAAEMAAFAKSEGGVIFLGVADDGSLPGLSLADVSRLNQMISNVAAQHIYSPFTMQMENVELEYR